ncbi:mechanosensitive ion channel family protein [Chromohalobacter canadensis]|uniref:Mechanosensitive ion channel family protein n=1 Tax=Chromohalobacter canadensis TaxID=141389 RepID=A0A285VMD7_9GAMM|nr:mechanosensitive ion channel family protein [Chromohalobacter canadensis]MCK0769029.1 mechanosensitive ion channel family protein [Chromohalobacter canadensis]WQH09321.1 mechanosensitive ion channel family protein [Chromohalobacter canadensis]SOC55229.1 MscS family membrane protein [Chromohalobacter canadensis]
MFDFFSPVMDWIQTTLGMPLWVAAMGLVIALTLIVDLVSWVVIWRVGPLLEKTSNRWADILIKALRRPLRLWIWLMGVTLCLTVVRYHWDIEWAEGHLAQARAVITLLLLAWAGLRAVKLLEKRLVFPPGGHRAKSMDADTASAVSKILGAVVVVIIGLLILSSLGVSPSGVAAFGGAGGLIIGFAAKDMLANFLGGLMIHLDKPFRVGDWIKSPDRDIEGVVEDIGWRLTRIRTFASRPIYIPNSAFSSLVLENPSRMWNRRLFETIRVRYTDIERVSDIVKATRAMLDAHDDVETNEQTLVYFQSYGEHALELIVYAFAKTTDWAEFQSMKQDILLRVYDIVREHDARLALPASELHIAGPVEITGETSGDNAQGDADNDENADDDQSDTHSRAASDREAPYTSSRQRSRNAGRGEVNDASQDHDQESDA